MTSDQLEFARRLKVTFAVDAPPPGSGLVHLYREAIVGGERKTTRWLVATDGSVLEEDVFVTRVGPAEPAEEGAEAATSEVAPPSEFARDFAGALRAGDEARARATARLAEIDIGPAGVRARVIAPAMHWIGALWEAGSLSMAEERAATSIAERVLAEIALREARQPHAPGLVLAAAITGEQHVLGVRIAADVLAAAGHDVRFLGGDVGVEELLAAVAAQRPRIVALGVTQPEKGGALRAVVEALRSRHPEVEVIVGGAGVPPDLRSGGLCTWVPDAEALARLLAGRSPGQPPPRSAGRTSSR